MKVLFIVVLGLIGVALFLLVVQHRLIYFPRPYDASYAPLFAELVELHYRTEAGQQVAFYFPPPKTSSPPAHVWMLFGGIASLALNWIDFVQRFPDQSTGFLLIDYPGYGKCEGKASPTTILQSTEQAVDQLAKYLQIDRAKLEQRLGVMGHSLGTAAALLFAARHPIDRVILLAPFTSLFDMACRIVGIPLCYLLLHNYDNRARLAELAAHPVPPQVTIIHGNHDEVVPVEMARELAQLFPHLITYLEVEQGSHNDILSLAEPHIWAAMGVPL